MIKIFFFFLLSATISHAQSEQCIDIFIAKPKININQPQIFTGFDDLVLRGRTVMRGSEFTAADKAVFERILTLDKIDLKGFTNRQLLDIYMLFARWNFLPPVRLHNAIFAELTLRVKSWTPKYFLSYAISRKISPMPMPKSFTNALKVQILEKFSTFNANVQLEVLSAELFSQTSFTVREMNFLLDTATQTLAATTEKLSLKPLKETYRGLLLLRATQPTVFFEHVLRLEEQLERHMQLQFLTFSMDGTSGSDNIPSTTSPLFLQFEANLESLFFGEEILTEYSNPGVLGFYDPVDIFYPKRFLVVEWDGRHHYFRNLVLDSQGKISGYEGEVLRPMDRVRDLILRSQGYSVLRVTAASAGLDSLQIIKLIEEQNPKL